MGPAGKYEKAIETLDEVLSVPSSLSVALLRLDAMWDPLRGNPRFESLLEPKRR